MIFGLARSGLSTIKAVIAGGGQVIAWDDNEAQRDKAAALGAEIAPITKEALKGCEALVLAPGVPLYFPKPHAVVLAAQEAGLEIICDVELFTRVYPEVKTIGITGTNGKSTTTALIAHCLRSCGVDAVMGGNIGVPVFDLDMREPPEVVVLELSSYQLDLCPLFKPDIAALLNISPDHLERHGTMDAYAASKASMFDGAGHAVIACDDAYTKSIAEDVRASGTRELLCVSQDDNLPFDLTAASLKGIHNKQNALIAYHCARLAGAPEGKIAQGIDSFPGLAHRQYLVREIGGVAFINDSKATNVDSAAKALATYDHIYWVVGGLLKTDDGLNGLEIYKDRIAKAYVIGAKQDYFMDWLAKHGIDAQACGTMDVAVEQASQDTKGEKATVLLSPACASFDQYTSFEARGDHFVELVQALPLD